MEYKIGDLVYQNKYHRGLLEVVEVHEHHVVVGKNSRVGIHKHSIRTPTKEELENHFKIHRSFKMERLNSIQEA